MIPLTCSHCGSKLRVKDEYAGRRGHCPTCKKPVVVPSAAPAAAAIPSGRIQGTRSSLQQAGIEVGVTLDAPRSTNSRSASKSVAALLAGQARHGNRYTIEGEIARGGMGAVIRAVDADIRREVAIKYMLDQTNAGQRARFVEEAQITGQLEHPNIVPIHELGVDSERRLFFSMKMVRGRSLGQILTELCEQPAEAEKQWSLGRLLNIFVNVCHALAYAHSRCVIHRDLKPANIMVGDFGEVYVMDWGLAKVMGTRDKADMAALTIPPGTVGGSNGSAGVPPASLKAGETPAPQTASGTHRIVTDREITGDLTQGGAIMGTPAYMSPEQASGESESLDGRSDIYSLGAILYEILTLDSPVKRDGGHLAVLLRVTNGEIQPPEQRVPARARQGKIPKELSAVAMKALALKPAQRYSTVEALRHDVELFQEGRGVSAKHDTAWESAVKFVKRNKGFSAATAAGTLLLAIVGTVSVVVNYQARVRAENNYAEYLREQQQRRAQAKSSVPAFVEAARLAVDRKDFDAAKAQVDVALDFDPDYAKARLLKAQLFIGKRKFDEAREMLAKYVEQKPDDADTARLLELCAAESTGDLSVLGEISDVLFRQGVPTLAEELISDKKQLAEFYRKRIEAAWPGTGARFTVAANGALSLFFNNRKEVRDLGPLRGIPLSQLLLRNTSVADLSPLKDMPLTILDVGLCPEVSDLSPLAGKKLISLVLDGCAQASDLRPLAKMPLEYLSLRGTAVRDLSPLVGMPLKTLMLGASLRVENIAVLRGMPLTFLDLSNCLKVRDFSPLKDLPLTELSLYTTAFNDLTLLKTMPLKTLDISICPISDLTALQGHKLTSLHLFRCHQLKDLSPLANLPLTFLSILDCSQLNDLSGLRGMQLESIRLTPKFIKAGTEALREMKSLKSIFYPSLEGQKSLPPAEFWPRFDAGEFNK